MQISKFLPAICAIAFCASFISVRADEDNPAQAAARAALMEKLNGAEAPATVPAPETPAPAAEAPPAPSAPAAPEPAATNAEPNQTIPPAEAAPAPEPVQPAAPVAPVMDNPPATTVPAPVETIPAPVQAEPAPAVPAAADTDTEAQAAARAALMEKMSTLDSQQPAPAAAANPDAASVVAKPVDMDNSAVVFRPIEAPALPISMSKAAQLQALLAKYKADQITPEQYHKQRAAILAQP